MFCCIGLFCCYFLDAVWWWKRVMRWCACQSVWCFFSISQTNIHVWWAMYVHWILYHTDCCCGRCWQNLATHFSTLSCLLSTLIAYFYIQSRTSICWFLFAENKRKTLLTKEFNNKMLNVHSGLFYAVNLSSEIRKKRLIFHTKTSFSKAAQNQINRLKVSRNCIQNNI